MKTRKCSITFKMDLPEDKRRWMLVFLRERLAGKLEQELQGLKLEPTFAYNTVPRPGK